MQFTKCKNETLTFILNYRHFTEVAHTVSMGKGLSIFNDMYVVHIVQADEFFHKSNLEPRPVDCRQY